VVRVRDTGPGVPEHLKTRVFVPFFTTREKGTGLGLGICFGIVEEHGGSIRVENDPEGGAVFTVTLPLREMPEVLIEESDVDSAVEVITSSTTPSLGRGRRVLVVDDDTFVSDVVSRTLTNHDYEVRITSSGSEALAALDDGPFDVIITDIRMPGEIDGIELFDRVTRRYPELARRFVFMTGNLLDTRTMGRLEGMRVRFLEKPFDIHHLASVVHDVATLPDPAAEASTGDDR
jgi:CheY-like chemotaxis protein